MGPYRSYLSAFLLLGIALTLAACVGSAKKDEGGPAGTPIDEEAAPRPDEPQDVALRSDGLSGYVLGGDGALAAFGGAPGLSPLVLRNGAVAVSFALRADGASGYAVDDLGVLQAFGGAPAVLAPDVEWGNARVRNVLLRADEKSGYLFDGSGRMHPFGDAPPLQTPREYLNNSARSAVLRADRRSGYVLVSNGSVESFGGAPALSPAEALLEGERALDFSMLDDQSGYLITSQGRLLPFGGAPPATGEAATLRSSLLRSVALNRVSRQGVVLLSEWNRHSWSVPASPEAPLVCQVGFANCDGIYSNGCEADLTTSLVHCSACNTPCLRAATSCEENTSVRMSFTELPATRAQAGEPVLVTGWVANCGTETLRRATTPTGAGVKIGAVSPADNNTWGASRYVLPMDIPPNSVSRFAFVARYPILRGIYPFSFRILEELVQWMGTPSTPELSSDVVPLRSRHVTLCAGVSADAGGLTPASAALQTCIDATPSGGTLELPPGLYLLDRQIRLTKPLTLRTAGTRDVKKNCFDGSIQCAVLHASKAVASVAGASKPYARQGLLTLEAGRNIVLDHIVVDGVRAARLQDPAAVACGNNDVASGVNVSNHHALTGERVACDGCAFRYGGFARALCASGLEVSGKNISIVGNDFRQNGDNNTLNMWSNGLSLYPSPDVTVTDNEFTNNTDVALILGGAPRGVIARNIVLQSERKIFAGLKLHNFSDSLITGDAGDYRGAVVTDNLFHCFSKCDYGLYLGPGPGAAAGKQIAGGTVTGNRVGTANIGVNIAGAGTAGSPIEVYGNTAQSSPSTATFGSAGKVCGERPGANFNLSPSPPSVVDRHGETFALAGNLTDCP